MTTADAAERPGAAREGLLARHPLVSFLLPIIPYPPERCYKANSYTTRESYTCGGELPLEFVSKQKQAVSFVQWGFSDQLS
jgi:hypothetical protein